jgi:hypothetical protein
LGTEVWKDGKAVCLRQKRNLLQKKKEMMEVVKEEEKEVSQILLQQDLCLDLLGSQ